MPSIKNTEVHLKTIIDLTGIGSNYKNTSFTCIKSNESVAGCPTNYKEKQSRWWGDSF